MPGGFEGGMTNGQPVVVRAAMKPLSTLMKPMRVGGHQDQEEVKATVERSDVCADARRGGDRGGRRRD